MSTKTLLLSTSAVRAKLLFGLIGAYQGGVFDWGEVVTR